MYIGMLPDLGHSNTNFNVLLCFHNLHGKKALDFLQSALWVQDIYVHDMTNPVNANTPLHGVYNLKQLMRTSTATTSSLLLSIRSHHTWPEVRQMIENLFFKHYLHLPKQTTANMNQDFNVIKGNKEGLQLLETTSSDMNISTRSIQPADHRRFPKSITFNFQQQQPFHRQHRYNFNQKRRPLPSINKNRLHIDAMGFPIGHNIHNHGEEE